MSAEIWDFVYIMLTLYVFMYLNIYIAHFKNLTKARLPLNLWILLDSLYYKAMTCNPNLGCWIPM